MIRFNPIGYRLAHGPPKCECVTKIMRSFNALRASNAAAENQITKPSAIIAGRAFPVWPTDAPSRIGSIGNVQGAATVTMPASSARTRLKIGQVHRTTAVAATRGHTMVFREAEAQRYLGRTWVASLVREAFGRTPNAKRRATRRGASRQGRWRYLEIRTLLEVDVPDGFSW
jgi:hypothetical protein